VFALTGVTGDRVQWFRSEAEVYRWLEEYELKHAEFERTIRTFGFWAREWSEVASSARQEGKHGVEAFARHQSAIYRTLQTGAKELYTKCGEPALAVTVTDNRDEEGGGGMLWERVDRFRNSLLAGLKAKVRMHQKWGLPNNG
jgi:hypothetical protein